MAKRKLSPFTVDDASDAFVPTVKEYISSEPEKASPPPKEKKSPRKKASAPKSPPKTKKSSPKAKISPEPVPSKMEIEKPVETPPVVIPPPVEAVPAKAEAPPISVAPETKPETVVIPKPPPQIQPPEPAQKVQTVEEAVYAANHPTGDTEEDGFQDMAQFVGFILENEAFGIDILLVREIIRVLDITPVPETEDYVEGVINLRGKVIPIINLRAKLDLAEWEEDKDARIIIIEHEGRMIGLTVDRVSEVIRIPKDAIEPPPAIAAGIESEYLDGVAKTEDQLIVLLNITRLLAKQLQKVNS